MFTDSFKYLSLITVIVALAVTITACEQKANNQIFDYGTKNDSARFYFHKGWEEIMDNGRWTESEIAFRKASKLDPNWALGKSMVGRITRNLKEREQLLDELQKTKHKVQGYERLLLDVNILSLKAANNRDQGINSTKEFNQDRWTLAENNFGAFIRKHIKDNYFKAEYIELLHLNHGAQTALDSMILLATPKQRQLGFYKSYEASLELELGNTQKALVLLNQMQNQLKDSSYNAALVLEAQIYKHQGDFEKAKNAIDNVVKKDSNHLIAKGIKKEIEKLLNTDD